jgi:hypothetical protein
MIPGADIVPPDIMLELQKFDGAADQLFDSFFKTIEVVPWPPVIYHYTNDVGLRGILETGKLWLTDMFNLNDPSELSHGLSHLVNILNGKAVGGPPESKSFSLAFQAYLRQGGYQKFAQYFVCSFSSAGDDLGQWRAYADNGRGYALGFDAGRLVTAFKQPGDRPIPNNATLPMTYDDGKCTELHKQLVEGMFHLIALPHGQALDQLLYAKLAMHTARIGLVFKHEAYNNEKEFRFVEMHAPDMSEVQFRTRPYSLVKYREFDWRSSAQCALKRIVIGPAADHDKALQFATDCLRSFHGTTVELAQSKIPYRVI